MADPWCWWGKPTGSGVSPSTLEPNVGPPGTQRLEGMQPEEELMSSLVKSGCCYAAFLRPISAQSSWIHQLNSSFYQLISTTSNEFGLSLVDKIYQ
ncbi:hypothetical protein EYF80_011843 [Liparis tanakae]|uniref:Uncharacterized protein n=1 Tax=Liparis tanakae TaxID=230148 RepID=A0A4Z2IIS8_9TELE|nr:hypothetical protein EYF80_011843 [Liparis tanakae]